MKNNLLVSILLLTYNHERYIKDCIFGILSQDYAPIELIILDDASTDKTVNIIKSFQNEIQQKFCNFIFLRNKNNCGNIPHNINVMLEKSKGFYIKTLSGDDVMGYNCISRLVSVLIDNPQCSVAYSNQYIVNENYKIGDKVFKKNRFYFFRESEVEYKNIFKKLMMGNYISAPTSMIKKAVFDKIGTYDESIPYEDYEFWLRIAYHNGKFYYLNECLVYYRRGKTSLTNYHSKESKRKIKLSMLAVGKTLRKYLYCLSKEDQVKCKKQYYNTYLKLCWDVKFWRGIFSILFLTKKNDICLK